MLIGMSQEKLGELLGLTFQQVQKYEKGTNRIGASRLYQIAQFLGTSVQFFFEDISGDIVGGSQTSHGFAERDAAPYVMEFVSSAEGLELNRSYSRILDPRLRKRILELVRCLAQDAVVGEHAGLGEPAAADDDDDEDEPSSSARPSLD